MTDLIRDGKSCTGAFQKLLKSIYVALMQFVPLLLCRTTIRWWLANTKNVPSPWRTRHGPCGLLATCKRAAYEMLYCWNTIWCSNGLPCRYASIPDEEFWAEWIVVFSYWPFGGKYHAIPSQIALSWTMNKRPWIIPILGTCHLCRLKENAGAADVHMTDEK